MPRLTKDGSCIEPGRKPRMLVYVSSYVKKHSSVVLAALIISAYHLALPSEAIAKELSEEYKLKAALIYKLPKFVKWPNEAFKAKPDLFTMCYTDLNTLGGALNSLHGRRLSGKNINIVHTTPEHLLSHNCQLIYIGKESNSHLPGILKQVRGKPILTISDIDSFALLGGHIEIYNKGKRLAFRINNSQAKNASLELASPLLDMATVIER